MFVKAMDRASMLILSVALAATVAVLAVILWNGAFRSGLLQGMLGLTISGLVLIAVTLLISLAGTPALRRIVAGGFLILLLGLYALEWAVAMNEDRRTKTEVVRDLRAGRPEAVGSIPPMRLFTFDDRGQATYALESDGRPLLPLGGISSSLTAHCREFGRENTGWIVYESDEHGFNNPRNIWNSGFVEVMFLGDSMTHGNCVPRDKDIVSSVRGHFPRTLNVAMQGNGPLMELAALKEFGPAVRPKRVVWTFVAQNDITDIGRERNVPLLRAYLDGNTQGLSRRQTEIDAKLRVLHERKFLHSIGDERLLSGYKDFLLLRMTRTKMDFQVKPGVLPVIYDDETLALFEKVVLEARQTVESWGGEFYFAYLPSIREVVYRHDNALYLRRLVLAMVQRNGLRLIDVNLAFETAGNVVIMWQCRACHYSTLGFKIASDTILAALEGAPASPSK